MIPTLFTSGKFLAYSLGPAAYSYWGLFFCTATVIILAGLAASLRKAFIQQGWKKDPTTLVLILFFSLFLFFALVIGWGRAALVPTVGMPIRYVIFASPVLCVCFFAWERHGSVQLKQKALTIMMALMLLLLPFNSEAAFYWRDWYTNGMKTVEQDIAAGLTKEEIAKKHKAFLIHWWEEKQIISHLQMLQQSAHSPFSQLKDKNTAATLQDK
jgi:hypothetical protein